MDDVSTPASPGPRRGLLRRRSTRPDDVGTADAQPTTRLPAGSEAHTGQLDASRLGTGPISTPPLQRPRAATRPLPAVDPTAPPQPPAAQPLAPQPPSPQGAAPQEAPPGWYQQGPPAGWYPAAAPPGWYAPGPPPGWYPPGPPPGWQPMPPAAAEPPPLPAPLPEPPPEPEPVAVPPAGATAVTGTPPAGRATVTRVAAARSRELTVATVRRVQAASRADGAAESGLAQLLWTNALHAAGDAMIAVSLAGTLFFAATTDAQRSNVALYLLVTMAPFAVVAPIIGPLLDRMQRGRRWAMGFSAFGRAVLAIVMAAHYDDLILYPAALGVLVLSKAYNVLRGAVLPRVLPGAMSLTSANSRTSVFGLLTAAVLGAIGAGIATVFGFPPELWATAAVFTAAGVLAIRLPPHVDVPVGEQPADVLTTTKQAPGGKRQVSPHVVVALRANSALRGLGGFLTIFAAFLVQATATGWAATFALGGIAAAAGVGSVAGTAVGSRLHRVSPDRMVLVSAGVAAGITVVAAIFYSLPMAALVAGVSAVTNALGKVSLDAIIQREVPDSLRASAFARSETMLQLAWVVGGALGIALPTIGWLGFTVAAALLVLTVGFVLWGRQRQAVTPPAEQWAG